jgi:hypothetical protein
MRNEKQMIEKDDLVTLRGRVVKRNLEGRHPAVSVRVEPRDSDGRNAEYWVDMEHLTVEKRAEDTNTMVSLGSDSTFTFRKGDKVKLEGVITGFYGDSNKAQVGNYSIDLSDLELVERPGPKLEDLPDGTVIRRANGPVLEVYGGWVHHVVSASRERIERVSYSFTVIGAKPGTPAWTLFITAVDRLGWYDALESEWWVQA